MRSQADETFVIVETLICPLQISHIPRLFADDSCLFLTAKNVVDLEIIGNSELSSLKNWMDTNKLTVNSTKSKLIVVNPKLRAPQIQFSSAIR